MDFRTFQEQAHSTDEAKKTTVSLYGLAGEVGSIFSVFKKRVRDKENFQSFKHQLEEELGDALWYVASLASLHDIDLNQIAEENIKKAKAFFDEGDTPHFDANFEEKERLPRTLRVTFTIEPTTQKSQMSLDGNPLGDPLDDNVAEEDHYRFHDIFHLSFMTFLSWSPVMRALLKRKRKSDPVIDNNEDGARAKIIEEAVSAIIFDTAEDNDFFPDPRSIPFGLLKTINRITRKYEVRACTFKQWQQAIWSACKIYNELKKHGGGTVELDLDERRIDYVGTPG